VQFISKFTVGRGQRLMEFRILGPVAIGETGTDADIGGPRERALLARLIISANHVVAADAIADALWSGEPPPHYAGTLRVYISRLRRALGHAAGSLVTQPPGYRLNLDQAELDAYVFERLAADGNAELRAGRPSAAADQLSQALALWRGPPLADVADEPFAHAYAARLEEGRLAAVESHLAAQLACGHHAALVGQIEQLIDGHALREQLWSLRIVALYRCGRQAEALEAFRDLRAMLADELGIEPSSGLRDLHERVLRQDPGLDWSAPAGEPPTAPPVVVPSPIAEPGVARSAEAPAPAATGSRLPHETTSFIGRERELATVAELLHLSRLVTLTGPGGSGKSRLARKYGWDAGAQHPDGVVLVELAPLIGPEFVADALADALSVREEPGRSVLDTVAENLADARVLLIMDNCEHVLDTAAAAVTHLLRACPGVRILATSQSRLGIDGEASWPVQPLGLPEPALTDPGLIGQAEAVRLLCDRAALARPGALVLTVGNAQQVAEICRRLDGIPLAIELAAARLNALTVGQLADRLDDRFRLLTGGNRTALTRHRALLAAIEWSHDLLSRAEQTCLRRLAVFTGGCTLEAAEVVCPGGDLPADLILEAITALVDRSLLVTEERSGSMRYRMLESISQYAGRQLDAAGERPGAEQRHLAWLLEYAGEADFDGPDQSAWLDRFDADLDNFRAGLERALDGSQPRHDPATALALAGLLAPFWQVRGPIELGRRWLEAALMAAGADAEPRLRALALDGLGQLGLIQGDQQMQLACQQESLQIWRSLQDLPRVARCLGDLGSVEHVHGDYDAARARYTEALDLARGCADDTMMARALSGLGRIASFQNNLAQSTEFYEESMAKFLAAGDLRRATTILGNLGVVAFHRGDADLAIRYMREHLANSRRLGDRKLIGGALTNLGDFLFHRGDLEESASLQRQALEIAEQIGDRRMAACVLTNLGIVTCAQGDYAPAWRFLQRGLDSAVIVGEPRAVAESLEEIATVESAAGRPDRAAQLLGAARAIRDEIGSPLQLGYASRIKDAADAAETALGDECFSSVHAKGAAMSLAEAVEFARTAPAPESKPVAPAPAAQAGAGLTAAAL
jgi:predicted ATPase/DNA-binding SARP family transcriptional activator